MELVARKVKIVDAGSQRNVGQESTVRCSAVTLKTEPVTAETPSGV
jgi:hypothetical protein